MKIGINGRFLVAKRTGVQRAAYNLLQALVEIDQDNEYLIFTGYSQLNNPDWKSPNVTVIPSNIRVGESFRNHIWEQFILPKLAKKHAVDILHSPANMAPLLYRGKSIIHIHDLCFVVNPQWYSFSFHTVYNFLVPRLARRATRITTNSNNAKNDLLQFCTVDASKVSLIYWAVDQTFSRRPSTPSPSPRWLPEEYILYVGSLEPRKNIRTLVRAFELLRRENPQLKTKLVLIGGESPVFGEVRLKIKDFKEDVLFKGFVSDKLLRDYYRHAKLVAYPSLYEGFGLPPLEAMASGTPVVTSNTSSIPEVVGDAAIMVNPYDTGALARAMARVISDDDLRQDLINKGYRQVRKFNWIRVARNTLAVYHEVANSSESGDGAPPALPIETWRKLRKIEQQLLGNPT